MNRHDATITGKSSPEGINRHDATIRDGLEPGHAIDVLATSVLDAAFEVHRTLGPGFLESVYEQALSMELTLRRIPFARQLPVGIRYKGREVGDGRLDLLIDGALVVEIKAVEQLAPIHIAQVISYLKAGGYPLGLLITFNVARLADGIRRVILSSGYKSVAVCK